jgi:hypothetical protein
MLRRPLDHHIRPCDGTADTIPAMSYTDRTLKKLFASVATRVRSLDARHLSWIQTLKFSSGRYATSRVKDLAALAMTLIRQRSSATVTKTHGL